jgi:DNA gyrase subunit A
VDTGYLFFSTRGGEVKRLRMEDLPGMRSDSFKVMDIEPDDALGWVLPTNGENEVILTTRQAQAIRFKESDVRPTGLGAGGMRGVKLEERNDGVVGANVGDSSLMLITITEDGVAKSSPLAEYPTQGRAGMGVVAMKLPKESRGLVASTVGNLDDVIILLTSKNRGKSMKLASIPQAKRANKGDYVISVANKEEIVAVTRYEPIVVMEESTADEVEEVME